MAGLESTMSYAATGAALGSALPGIGTAIGAGVGAFVGLFTDLWGGKNDAQARILQAESDILSYKTNILATGAEIEQTRSNISAYEDFLAAFPNYEQLQKGQFEMQARNEFRQLRSAYAGSNTVASATGRTGGSAALVSGEAKMDLAAYAGGDLEIGDDNGMYGMAKRELYGNLETTQKQYKNQLSVYQTSLGTLQETQGLYQQALGSAEGRLKGAKKAKRTWWNPFD